LFGDVQKTEVTQRTHDRLRGSLELEWATVNWFLSINLDDLPPGHRERGLHAYRTLTMGDDSFDFSSGFDDLHSRVYEGILEGRGYRIQDARPSIDLVHNVRTCELK
jgi:UDP-N-acetyl-2-amino-2-deoxyglucuronate dehydrogenase